VAVTRTRESIQDEQRIYARWLSGGARLSLALLAVTFLVYLGGFVAPAVPIAELPRYWGLSAAQYVAATGGPTGWAWVGRMGQSDVMNLAGIAGIALVTPICFMRLLFQFIAQREHAYAVIVVIELAVLAVAASGILTG
jgi:hypothetical protein